MRNVSTNSPRYNSLIFPNGEGNSSLKIITRIRNSRIDATSVHRMRNVVVNLILDRQTRLNGGRSRLNGQLKTTVRFDTGYRLSLFLYIYVYVYACTSFPTIHGRDSSERERERVDDRFGRLKGAKHFPFESIGVLAMLLYPDARTLKYPLERRPLEAEPLGIASGCQNRCLLVAIMTIKLPSAAGSGLFSKPASC